MLLCKNCNKEFKHHGSLSKHTCFSLPVSWVETRKEISLKQYYHNVESESICKCCGKTFKRTSGGLYCSQSCAAKVNNKLRAQGRTRPCSRCGNLFTPRFGTEQKYCSIACSSSQRRADRDYDVEQGLVTSRPKLKSYLIRRDGHECSDCHNTTWKCEPIPLELDHIDGDATNNNLINLRVLCPNCHAMTPTYKARNKGNGRQSRGLRSN